jgi:enterochelin esterase-like enzyme
MGEYPAVVLEEEIPFRVYLPPCYDPGGGASPTLYALHGKPFDEWHWDDLGLDEVAEAGIAAGDWPPFLIVMPYLPEPLFSSTDGGPGSYEQELLEGLIPFIEANYGSEPSAASRWLAGISRGGVWALEVGLSHPEVFGGVAALSPALAVNHSRPQYDPLVIAAGTGPFPPRLFLSAGETDWARAATERLGGILGEAGAAVVLQIAPGGHERTVWEAALRPMLETLAGETAQQP